MALEAFAEVWGNKYPQISKSWRAHWENAADRVQVTDDVLPVAVSAHRKNQGQPAVQIHQLHVTRITDAEPLAGEQRGNPPAMRAQRWRFRVSGRCPDAYARTRSLHWPYVRSSSPSRKTSSRQACSVSPVCTRHSNCSRLNRVTAGSDDGVAGDDGTGCAVLSADVLSVRVLSILLTVLREKSPRTRAGTPAGKVIQALKQKLSPLRV